MAKVVQIRNMPEKMHRVLKARAAEAGMSLSEYLLAELRKSAETPTMEEVFRRLESRKPLKTSMSAAAVLREERDRQ